jgi:hypothetical protein
MTRLCDYFNFIELFRHFSLTSPVFSRYPDLARNASVLVTRVIYRNESNHYLASSLECLNARAHQVAYQ